MEHLDQPNHNHPVANALRARLAPPHVAEREVAHVWAGVQARLADAPVLNVATTPRTHTYLWRSLALAAALTIGFFAIKYIPNLTTTQTPTVPTKTYATQPGQRATITLAEGSQVILAPATKLQITGRNVELEGEAVFTVTQHNNDPFTVQAGNTITRVLGTTFAVRAYGDQIRVAVQDGKVAIQGSESGFLQRASAANAERSSAVVPLQQQGQARTSSLKESQTATVLGAGDIATLTNNQVTVTHDPNTVQSALAFAEGKLVFRRAPLRDVLTELERAYDVTFNVTDKALLSAEVTTTLLDRDLHNALYKLAELLNARYQLSGRTITFTPKSQ